MSEMKIERKCQVWRNKAGQYHRVDGPAYIHPNGTQAWWLNGMRHRLDGPAFIHPNGSQAWFSNGERHRSDGPARIWSDGRQVWYLNGLYHRLDGPAFIYSDGSQSWWITNFEITDHATAWIKENDFPDYTSWTDSQKIMFRLAFSGITS